MRVITALLLLVGLCTTPARAQDLPGSKDHPIITRYPGSVIQWYRVENHRSYRVPTGPVSGYRQVAEGVDTEGRLTRIYYTLAGGARSDDEVYANYREALAGAGFDILAAGYEPAGGRSSEVGSRKWREVLFLSNPWGDTDGAVNEMTRGSASSGGGGAVVARKERAEGTAYVIVTVYRFREDQVSTLVDVLEVASAQTGLIVVDAEAIGAGIAENGRVVLDGLHFDFDQATLRAESKPALDQIALYLKAQPTRQFYVVGHTDAQGTLDYNRKLSAERAQAVVTALVESHGIARSRLEAHGVGPLVPVFANASEAGRERNRRVELVEK
jgi:OOP family OmpA-OmpF porin